MQTFSELPATERPADVLLLLAGADRLIRRGDEARSQLLVPLTSLLSEAIGTGVRVMLGGLPALADSRLGVNIERRFVLSLPGDLSPTSYGVPRELSVDLSGRGRAVDVASKRLCQFASLDGQGRRSAEVILTVAKRLDEGLAPTTNQPMRLTTMGWPIPLPNDLAVPADLGLALPLGFDLENGTLAWVDVEEDGPLIVVAGPSRSGRSTTLLSVAELASRLGWTTAGVAGSRRSQLRSATTLDYLLEPNQVAQRLSELLAERPDGPLLLLLDDAQRLDVDAFDSSALAEWPHAILLSGPIEFMGRPGWALAEASSAQGWAVAIAYLSVGWQRGRVERATARRGAS